MMCSLSKEFIRFSETLSFVTPDQHDDCDHESTYCLFLNKVQRKRIPRNLGHNQFIGATCLELILPLPYFQNILVKKLTLPPKVELFSLNNDN